MDYGKWSDRDRHLSQLAMKYKEMIEQAQSKGLASEQKMWASVGAIDAVLCKVKAEHPEMYWAFMREQHGLMYDGHYTGEYAEHDVENLMWRDCEGNEHRGAHWTREQIRRATEGKEFPMGTTEWDRYVAYNVMYSDLCRVLSEEKIAEAAYEFFFRDDDYDYAKGGKVWDYMS